VCGLARPEQFFNTVDSLEFRQVLQKTYADHYWYTKEDINEWTLIANRLEVDFIVTSEKDAMRLTKFDQLDTPICFIEQAVEWLGPIPYPDKPDIALPLSAKG
jgi:tetraacyldisaccharide-1-P 4'-kinase